LRALSPTAVLSRGYSITTDSQGKVVRDALYVEAEDDLEVRLKRGSLSVKVTKRTS
jgi:exodeoxyribonuclease VII large subunit